MDNTPELQDLKLGIVSVSVRVLIDLERVVPVASSSPFVGDRVDVVRINLANEYNTLSALKYFPGVTVEQEEMKAHLVNLSVDVIGNKDLTGVDHAVRPESSVLESLPLGVKTNVNMRRSSGVVTWEDSYFRGRIDWSGVESEQIQDPRSD